MKIGQYISELLYTYDSVTLPGFGTFSTRYEPARFIPEKKIVESPSKIAHFSPEPKHGDSLLVDFIAEKEGKSVEEVTGLLNNMVTEIEHALEAGNQVEIESIGMLHKDLDGILKFEPNRNINFLENYTGVSSIKTPEQKSTIVEADLPQKTATGTTPATSDHKESGTQAISQKKRRIPPKKRKAMTEPEKKESKEKEKLPPALKWTAIVLIPLLLILIIFFLNYNFFVGEDGIFRKTTPVVTEEVEEYFPVQIADEEKEEEEEVIVEVDVPDPEPAFDPYLEPPKPPIDRPVYIVVVGSFRNYTNAQNLALKLRKDGAQLASVLDRTHSGFHRTYSGYYFNLREAEAAKAELDDDLREIAWILHR